MRRLVLPDLRPFNELVLRVFVALVLPLVLDGRAISAPKGQQGYLIGPSLPSGSGRRARIELADGLIQVESASFFNELLCTQKRTQIAIWGFWNASLFTRKSPELTDFAWFLVVGQGSNLGPLN